jgi:hypothetical protein
MPPFHPTAAPHSYILPHKNLKAVQKDAFRRQVIKFQDKKSNLQFLTLELLILLKFQYKY